MSSHAVYSPSGHKKWAICPGSIALEHDIPNLSSNYADEGTAAHALAAMCLKEGKDPSAYLGRTLHVYKGEYVETLPKGVVPGDLKDEYGKHVTQFLVDDMVPFINTYVQSVRAYAEGHEMQVEQQVPVGHITGEKGATGTSDVIIITADGNELQVHDLKYGMGVRVFAANNPQGMDYLCGALEQNRAAFEAVGEMPRRFRFVIHQPRLNHLDEWDCSYDELMAHAEQTGKDAFRARNAFENRDLWLGKETPLLVPGKHCKSAFCRARATCPALAKMVADEVGAQFDVLTEAPPVPTDLKTLGAKFAVLDIIADWCKQVRAKAEGALFEFNNSVEAQTALGIKLVEGKKGNRQWEDAAKAEALMKKKRMKTEEIYDLSVKTPPAIEKAIKEEHPKWWTELEALVTQKKGQPSVAPLADKRPALVMKPAADAFDVTDGSDLV